MATRNLTGRLWARLSKPANSASRTPLPAPWWVRAFTTLGRPVVALAVLTMCAPGEHHLAVLAGWDDRLAWAMAAVLAAYAGIAAAVASARPKGAPGKRSAVAGAVLSLAAAGTAQPVSHLFVTGHLSASPNAPVWLVVTVSCVPPLVLGHLLHLAASPVAHPEPQPALTEPGTVLTAERPEPETVPAAIEQPPALPPSGVDLSKPEPAEPPTWLTTAEVALYLGVSASTVGTWVQRGKLTPARQDARGRNLFDPAVVAALTA